MSVSSRLLWLHKKIAAGCYPNSSHLMERFDISQRQAQRDFESLRLEFDAPIKYSSARRGYYYTSPFELSIPDEKDAESEYIDIVSSVEKSLRDAHDELQLRLPYTASLQIKDKLTVMDLRRFIVGKEGRDTYNCEFYNVDNFLGIMLVSDADIKVVKPEWLRDKVVKAATRILKNNTEK